MTAPGAIGLAGAPDLIEPVVGFRLWRLRDADLRSLHWDEPWPSATLVARCLAHGHPGEPAPDGLKPAPAGASPGRGRQSFG